MEKREFVRASVVTPIHLEVEDFIDGRTIHVAGKTINLSEKGLCFSVPRILALPSKSTSQIYFNQCLGPVVVDLKLLWQKFLGLRADFLYGARFLSSTTNSVTAIKKHLWTSKDYIKMQLASVLDLDKLSPDVREVILCFFTDELRRCIENYVHLEENIESIKKLLVSICNDIAMRGDEIEHIAKHRNFVKKVKQRFRSIVGEWAYESTIMKRAYDKPRGYPGDYRMLEIIYDNRIYSENLGTFFDRYFLDHPYAEAVRQRKEMMREVLKDCFDDNDKGILKILNLACGSCKEIRDLFANSFNYSYKTVFTLVDHDEEALEFSKSHLNSAVLPPNVSVEFLKENILKFPGDSLYYSKRLGRQDIIYSIGLIDYIPDRILKKIIRFCFDLLVPKGKLILTHKDVSKDTKSPIPIDWFCDWQFVPRSKEQVISLLKDVMPEVTHFDIKWESSGLIFFVIIDKPLA